MVIESGTTLARSSRAGAAETLGEWVRNARASEHLSQRALADRAGISRSYLCDIERRRGAQPSVSVLDKLAIALGASRSDLLKAAGVIEQAAGESGDAGERRIIAIYRDLSAEGKSAVERFARFLRDEEHRFVQPSLIEDELPVADQPFRQSGPTLFDLPPLGTR
jgi:transcriptional regulator with XRE-family HTH domain